MISVDSDTSRDDKAMLLYKVNHEGGKFLWNPNKTNMQKLIELGIKKPRDLVNKNMFFIKTPVRNPSTNQMVDSLVVVKIQ